MIRSFLSRYGPVYIRSLVYMLQASEYNVRDYLKWYHRTQDFACVERRKHLVKTPKALLLLGIGWVLLLSLYGAALTIGLRTRVPFVTGLGAVMFSMAPFLVAYLIIIPLAIIRFLIQRPVEYFLLRQMCQQLARHPAVKIAIAGSFGKTTMREILKTVLSQGKKVAATPFNTPLGIRDFVRGLTGDEEILVFEFGEYYPGDIKTLCRLVNPQWGVITGVNEAHLQRFKSLDLTTQTIFELSEWLGPKPLYVNGESELARKNAREGALIYSRHGVGEWKTKDTTSDLDGTKFILVRDATTLQLRSRLLGLHQVGPLAAAVDIAFRLGLSLEEVEQGIAATRPFMHRLERKVDVGGVIMLDDSYNGNPDGVRAVIEFIGSLRGYRRWYVTPGLKEIGAQTEAVHKAIGKKLADERIEKVILVKNSVTPHIAEGLQVAHYKGEVLWFDDAPSAFAALPHLTAKGDVVLLQNDWPDQYA